MSLSIHHAARNRNPRRQFSSPSQIPVMRRLATPFAFLAVTLSIGAVADALTLKNLAVGLVVISAMFVFQSLRPGRRSAQIERPVTSRPLAGAVVRGALAGVLFVGLLAVVLPLVALLPTPTTWSDWDRTRVENRIDALAAAGNFKAAAKLVENRLAQKMSQAWRAAFEQRHVELWIAAGDAATTADAKIAAWQRAADLARQYGIDARLPSALLARLGAETAQERSHAAANQSLADARQGQTNQLRQWLITLTAVDAPAARDALLRAIEQQIPREAWPDKLPQLLVQNLLRWADTMSNLASKRERLQATIAECVRRGFDAQLPRLKLAAVEAELAGLAPQPLPPGARGQLLNLYNVDPAMVFDIAIESAAAAPVENLAAKDFSVTMAGQPVRHAVLPAAFSTATDLSVVVLLDYSPSTRSVRSAAQTGVIALASSAPPGAKFRVLAFHDTVVPVTDWTAHFADIDARLRNFQTAGARTALGRALESGIAELRDRTGTKALIIFTDGRDTSGAQTDYAAVISRCRAAGIRVLAIGLESADLDAGLLAKLAAETGGKYVTASRQEELVERFRLLRLEKTTPVYRIGVLTTPEMHWPLQLTVGGGDHPLLLELPQHLPR